MILREGSKNRNNLILKDIILFVRLPCTVHPQILLTSLNWNSGAAVAELHKRGVAGFLASPPHRAYRTRKSTLLC